MKFKEYLIAEKKKEKELFTVKGKQKVKLDSKAKEQLSEDKK